MKMNGLLETVGDAAKLNSVLFKYKAGLEEQGVMSPKEQTKTKFLRVCESAVYY